jgi:hypothetical protein
VKIIGVDGDWVIKRQMLVVDFSGAAVGYFLLHRYTYQTVQVSERDLELVKAG